jgi:hypothetical protein
MPSSQQKWEWNKTVLLFDRIRRRRQVPPKRRWTPTEHDVTVQTTVFFRWCNVDNSEKYTAKTVEGSGRGIILLYCPGIYLKGLRRVNVPTQIRTGYLPNWNKKLDLGFLLIWLIWECCPLGNNAVKSGTNQPTLQRKILRPSSGQMSEPNKEEASRVILASFTLWPWRLRECVPPKRQ